MPICGRCIASGAPCDYGISNQGGRWKNGEKMGVARDSAKTVAVTVAPADSGIPVPESPISDQSFPDSTGITLTQHSLSSAGEPSIGCFRNSFPGEEFWGYEISCPQNPFQPFSTGHLPTTSTFPSPPPSSASSFWMPGTSESDQSQDFFHPMMPPPMERTDRCNCFTSTLSILQTLHQRFPQMSKVSSVDPNVLSYASVLDINEQAISCCATMLRCPSCRADDSGYSFILLATLIRKTLSMIETWVSGSDLPMTSEDGAQNMNGGVSGPFAGEQEDDRRLKAEVSLIGIKKMEEILVELRQAAQSLRVDYDRLACASLAASLSGRLKSASERLGAELDTKHSP
jgi:hypothetical protein